MTTFAPSSKTKLVSHAIRNMKDGETVEGPWTVSSACGSARYYGRKISTQKQFNGNLRVTQIGGRP